jgi:hypothetical protein
MAERGGVDVLIFLVVSSALYFVVFLTQFSKTFEKKVSFSKNHFIGV